MKNNSINMSDIDEKDRRVLDELRRDAKATTGRIAKRTAIPVTTVHNRIKRLEKEGVIIKYEPMLDYKKLGRGICALIFITVENKLAGGKAVDQEDLARRCLGINGVENARILTGGFDLALEARVADVDELNHLLIKELRKTPGVDKTQTMLVLEELRRP